VDVKDNSVDSVPCVKLSRLIGPDTTPLAVAFSGGGDSTALLSLVLKWARGRPVHALIVDHGLRHGSCDEARLALKRAVAMGAGAQILTCQWDGAIPTTGIQEKARNSRYHLLAKACQAIGARKLLLGHNQDDQVETVLMRKNAGSGWRGLAAMSERASYPVWPIVADLTIVRPLLFCTRAALRRYNRNNRLAWIDDPSNENRQFTRIRTRDILTNNLIDKQNLLIMAKASREVLDEEKKEIAEFIQVYIRIYEWGGVGLLAGFNGGKPGLAAEALRYLIPAISGHAEAPNVQKRMQLARKLRHADFGGATLGGVQFVPRKHDILCVRDPGAVIGRAQIATLPALKLPANNPAIWDGRFKLSSKLDTVTIIALGAWEHKIPGDYRALLKTIPKAARPCLLLFIMDKRICHIPFVDDPASVHGFGTVSLVRTRLASLLGHCV